MAHRTAESQTHKSRTCLLDVSELEVDRISVEVEDLRAHVSILVELANLLNLSVGVDARLD